MNTNTHRPITLIKNQGIILLKPLFGLSLSFLCFCWSKHYITNKFKKKKNVVSIKPSWADNLESAKGFQRHMILITAGKYLWLASQLPWYGYLHSHSCYSVNIFRLFKILSLNFYLHIFIYKSYPSLPVR